MPRGNRREWFLNLLCKTVPRPFSTESNNYQSALASLCFSFLPLLSFHLRGRKITHFQVRRKQKGRGGNYSPPILEDLEAKPQNLFHEISHFTSLRRFPGISPSLKWERKCEKMETREEPETQCSYVDIQVIFFKHSTIHINKYFEVVKICSKGQPPLQIFKLSIGI